MTTNTLENAIAAPATTGDNRPDMASGMAATLYANAQNRLPLIVPSVRRDRRIASAADTRSSPKQRQIAGLDRDIGAAPHRDAQIGLGERRRIVDTVADHRHRSSVVLQTTHDVDLVGRHHLGAHRLDPDLRRDPLGGRPVVAGEQHRFQTEPPQVGDRIGARRLDRVGDHELGEYVVVTTEFDDRAAGVPSSVTCVGRPIS